jgi:RimJ/RimL family protein N-acetyltransferase
MDGLPDDLPAVSNNGSPVDGASLEGRRVYLRPVTDADYGFLFALSTDEATGFRWRFRGETPSPETFAHGIWHNVIAQFIVCSIATDEPVGHVLAFNANLRHRHAQIAMVVRPDRAGRSWALEGAELFIDYVFANWEFRKLYAEVVDFNLPQFSSITDLPMFEVEGRLREHEYYRGRYWDVLIIALRRERWQEYTEAGRARREARRERARDLVAGAGSGPK